MKRSSALAIMFLIVLAACQAQAPQGPASKAGGQWVVAVTEEPDTLDAHKSTTALSDTILRYVGDPLIAKDQSGKYVPALAKSWTISPDGLTWTFQLRDDVKFHDGTAFDAAAMSSARSIFARTSGDGGTGLLSMRGVSIAPGRIAQTRTPFVCSSNARP